MDKAAIAAELRKMQQMLACAHVSHVRERLGVLAHKLDVEHAADLPRRGYRTSVIRPDGQ